MKVKVLIAQSCPALCNPIDYNPPGSSVHEILQARILEWVTIPFSRGSSWPRDPTQVFCIADRFFTIWATREAHNLWCMKVKVKSLSCVQLFATPWTIESARLLCPWNSPGKNTGVGSHSLLQGIFLTQGSKPGLLYCRGSPALQAESLPSDQTSW